jgi:hypothetical protein
MAVFAHRVAGLAYLERLSAFLRQGSLRSNACHATPTAAPSLRSRQTLPAQLTPPKWHLLAPGGTF